METIITAEMLRNNTIVDMWAVMVQAGVCKTNSEARRIIEDNALKMFTNGQWIVPEMFANQDNQTVRFSTVSIVENQIFRKGKRHFFKITFPN